MNFLKVHLFKFTSPLLLVLISTAWFATAEARLDYSARYNVNSCTACHWSPIGGGPKTADGKRFGAFGYKLNPALAQGYIAADLRALYYAPADLDKGKGGLAVMSGSVAARAPLDKNESVQLVLEHNIAGFPQAPWRDTYALFRLSQNPEPRLLETVQVGRFRAPFGAATDEHRTYVRRQTKTEWYAMEAGLLASGRPSENLHVDFALVNGDNAAGQGLGAGQAARWGSIANARWMPGAVLLGASVSYHDKETIDESRKAASLYAVLPVGRWTDDRIPLSITLEGVHASKSNDGLSQDFAGDANYVTSIAGGDSDGWLALFEWSSSLRFTWILKFDYLAPDRDYPADRWARQGIGFRYAFAPGALLHARLEAAQASHPSEASGASAAAQSDGFAILELQF